MPLIAASNCSFYTEWASRVRRGNRVGPSAAASAVWGSPSHDCAVPAPTLNNGAPEAKKEL